MVIVKDEPVPSQDEPSKEVMIISDSFGPAGSTITYSDGTTTHYPVPPIDWTDIEGNVRSENGDE
jgi:hypothetical protein